MKLKEGPEEEEDTETSTADPASAKEPPALTDSEYDSESDDESHDNALMFRKRRWLTKNIGMVKEDKSEIGRTVFNELKTDAFRPLGRTLSRSRAKQSNDRERATTEAHNDPTMKPEKGYSSKICMKKSYKNIHSEVVESKNRYMPMSL